MARNLNEVLAEDDAATAAGEQIIRLLGLKVKENGRVDTTVGDKYPAGLARTLLRFLDPDESID